MRKGLAGVYSLMPPTAIASGAYVSRWDEQDWSYQWACLLLTYNGARIIAAFMAMGPGHGKVRLLDYDYTMASVQTPIHFKP